MEELLHWDIRVLGKVQGVYYRASAEQKAWRLNITGFVKNMPDGSVYIEAEGTPLQLQQLVEWCKQGPPQAEVSEVIVRESTIKGYLVFDVRKD